VVGLSVAVPAPAVAATAVSDGIEKKVFSHAAGAAVVMLASLVSVAVSVALAPTTSGVVRVWALPLVPVEKFQITNEVLDEHPVWAVERALVVKPDAKVRLVGRFTPVTVTGMEFGLVIVTTTSPFPPGNSTLVAAGDATALMVRFDTDADCDSPEEPPVRPTVQLVAAYAATAARTLPETTEAIRTLRECRQRCVA
jgi:hypothetical protein